MKTIADLIAYLVLNHGEHILHIHDGVVQAQILAQSRVGLRPRLLDALLVLLLLGF